MSNKVYDILSIVSRVVIPVGTFLLAICNIWGLPYGEQIMATATALEVLLGALLVLANKSYQKVIQKLKDQENAVSVREEE